MANSKTTLRTKNGFVEGAVVKIKMKNFMTYTSVEISPGPRMNVIVGPNGTGKSTILCAICLALGGKPSIIGRANAIADYIKRGCDKSRIEVELCHAKGSNFVIKREITKNNQSSWYLNGEHATKKVIDELLVKLNIQMNNLCQFLPQDRVVDFVKMSPEELLENTEKAAGHPEMWEQHCKLKQWNTKSVDLEKSFEHLKEDLDKEIQKKRRLEEQMKIYEEKKKHMEKIELLKKKKVLVEYHEATLRYFDEKKLRDEKIKEIAQMEEKLRPLKSKLQKCNETIEKLKEETKKIGQNARQFLCDADKIAKEINRCIEEEADICESLKVKKKMEEERITKLHIMEQQLQSFESNLSSSLNDEESVTRQLQDVTSELNAAVVKMNDIQEKIENNVVKKNQIDKEIQSDSLALKEMKDVTEARLEVLRRRHYHTYQAVRWLRENKDKFKKTIHEPLLTVLNVPNTAHAKYFESHIAFKDLIAFVCEDADDLELFMSQLRDKQNLKINVVLAPETPSSHFKPPIPLNSITHWGFHSYLRELIDAPEAVLRYLCLQYHIHQVPVGNEKSKQLVENILKDSNFRHFYTENHQYACTISRYGNRAVSSRCTQLKRPALLTLNVDKEKMKTVEESIQKWREKFKIMDAIVVQLQQEEKLLNKSMEELRRNKKELTARRDFKGHLMAKIEQQKLRIQNNLSSKIDLVKEQEKQHDELVKLSDKKIKYVVQHARALKASFDANFHWIPISCKLSNLSQEKINDENLCNELSSALPSLKRELDVKTKETISLKKTAKQLLEKAKLTTGTEDLSLPLSLKESFDLLPSSLEELETELYQIQAELDCMSQASENIVSEYEKWTDLVNHLKQELESRQRELNGYDHDMKTTEELWLPPLNALIDNVNSRFSNYFKNLGCAGEVVLKKGEKEKDYNMYGISIRVKYRDTEPLRELTPHFQSGGERSVATILYLLALQEFINLPFCCVDEINQGMDSTNEQRVLQLMTQTLCQQSLSQYFLVTPKLLLTSEFDDNVTFHWVFNGKVSIDKWNINNMIRRRRSLNV